MSTIFDPKRPPSKDAPYARRFAWELIKENRSEEIFDVWLEEDEISEIMQEMQAFGCGVRVVKAGVLRVVAPPK